MERFIHKHLLAWKNRRNRKVLLLRGARQVGKTWSARYLGNSFPHFLEVNFELDRDIHSFFEESIDPNELCRNLSAYYRVPIKDGKTLLFFDEIQSCLSAISSLRFFYEKRPNLHVLAAGSLLEFSLYKLSSFGVGRIESLWMYPMSFDEFLLAKNEEELLALKLSASPQSPLPSVWHNRCVNLLRQFFLLGGLPEVIQTYLDTEEFESSFRIIDQLSVGLEDDFAKYKDRVPVSRLKNLFDSSAFQTGNKFIFSRSPGEDNHPQKKEALSLLEKASLIHVVYHSSSNGLPLGAEKNVKKFKTLLFDHGVFQKILGLDVGNILLPQNYSSIFRGNLAELFAGLEIIKYGNPFLRPQLFYWQREKRGSQAEVDYLFQRQNEIIPLEIKSGTKGSLQSLRLFLDEKKLPTGYRSSLENFGVYGKIEVVPLYALSNLRQRP